MPSLELNKVQEYERVPGHPSQARMVGYRPYWRVVHRTKTEERDENNRIIWNDDPPVIVQDGHYYGQGGDPMRYSEVPDWFWAEARKLPADRRKVYGIVLPEEKGGRPKKSKEPEVSELQEG